MGFTGPTGLRFSPFRFICSGCHYKTPHTWWFKQEKCIFLQFWRLEFQDQGIHRVGFSLASRFFLLPLSMVTPLSMGGCLCVLIPPPRRTAVRLDEGPPHSLILANDLFKGSISKHSPTPRYRGIGLQHMNLGG